MGTDETLENHVGPSELIDPSLSHYRGVVLEFDFEVMIGAINMGDAAWVELTKRERQLLLDGLSVLRKRNGRHTARIDGLTVKLVHADAHPNITVGVHGGQVQWTLGNPFPIRICDYDGQSDDDLPDVDERGQRCRMWWEPAATEANDQSRVRKR